LSNWSAGTCLDYFFRKFQKNFVRKILKKFPAKFNRHTFVANHLKKGFFIFLFEIFPKRSGYFFQGNQNCHRTMDSTAAVLATKIKKEPKWSTIKISGELASLIKDAHAKKYINNVSASIHNFIKKNPGVSEEVLTHEIEVKNWRY
jgi:hypothetical protein